MKIHLPNSAFLGNIDSFLLKTSTKPRTKLNITANKKWISVHPMILCMIAALGLEVGKENIKCEKFEAKSSHYFERMGLFKFLGIDSGISIIEHEPAGRFIPITQIKTSEELSHFIREMIPLLHLNKDDSETIGYVVSELVRNVIEHAKSKNGAILAAQYYKDSNTIRVGIADTGIGIRESINRSYNAKNDLDAIQLALTPGTTGTTKKIGGTEWNAGTGLFFIKSIAKVNRDYFLMYSGNSMYKLLKRKKDSGRIKLYPNPFDDHHSKRSDLPHWQGTVVGIDISLDKTQEFSTLLELLKKTVTKAIRERRKAIHKQAQFI